MAPGKTHFPGGWPVLCGAGRAFFSTGTVFVTAELSWPWCPWAFPGDLPLPVSAGGSHRCFFPKGPVQLSLRGVCLASAAASSNTFSCWGCSQGKHGNCSFNGVNQALKPPSLPRSASAVSPGLELRGGDSAGPAGWDSRAAAHGQSSQFLK